MQPGKISSKIPENFIVPVLANMKTRPGEGQIRPGF